MIDQLGIVAAAAKAATPLVNWSGLLKVLALAVGTGVVIVGGFSLGLAALDVYVWSLQRQRQARQEMAARAGGEAGDGGAMAVTLPDDPPHVRFGSLVVALFFFGVCVVGVVIGLIEMVSK
ncbi:MAG: hypothetical protein QOG45_197 [Chloroflexota bacterium]|nr:hypothetical protein [Chloroflexota bacterium]